MNLTEYSQLTDVTYLGCVYVEVDLSRDVIRSMRMKRKKVIQKVAKEDRYTPILNLLASVAFYHVLRKERHCDV